MISHRKDVIDSVFDSIRSDDLNKKREAIKMNKSVCFFFFFFFSSLDWVIRCKRGEHYANEAEEYSAATKHSIFAYDVVAADVGFTDS